ncbi:unnamed protein product, partial [Rotaria sp. Silwood1]
MIILRRLNHLRTLIIQDYTVGNISSTSISTVASTFQHSLMSLIIVASSLTPQHFELILSSTPSLFNLKLICKKQMFNSMFDASYWEQIVNSKLPKLKKLEFFFSYQCNIKNNFISLESLIASFQTEFWTHTKHWFVSSAYVPSLCEIWLHTTPINFVDKTKLIRCEISSIASTCRFTQQSLDVMLDKSLDQADINILEYKLSKTCAEKRECSICLLSN